MKKKDLVSALDVKGGDVRVSGLRHHRKGYVLEVHSNDDVERLRKIERLGELGIKVQGELQKRSPKVLVYDVAEDLGKEELLDAVQARNKDLFQGMTEEQIKEGFAPEWVIKGRRSLEGTRTWVVRVSPAVLRRLDAWGRVYIGVRSCRVVEYLGALRCFKCLGFGHTQARCARPVTCGWCGEEGHKDNNCGKREAEPCCVNCKKADFRDRAHQAMSRNCPMYKRNEENLRKITDYGS